MKWEKEVSAAINQARRLYARVPDPALVHAVIERETIHGALPITGTREPNGHYSYGPMQVLDTTGNMHGISEPSSMAIPSLGIRIGTFELSRLLTLFPNDAARAIAAYNAGSGNSARNAAGRFVNQPYVDAVLSFWNRYKGGAVAATPVLALVAAAILVMLMGRRRLAWR